MLTCCVKFCGGCNPRYDRGEAYKRIREALEGKASISLPEEGAEYDVLLILRGCTGCPYLYEEEVRAKHRIPVHSREEAGAFPAQLRKLMAEQQDS